MLMSGPEAAPLTRQDVHMAFRDRLPSGRTRARLGILILVLTLGGVLTLIDQRNTLMAPGPAPDSAQGVPDYYLEGVTYTRFDEQGQRAQTMESPRVSHTPEDDVTRAVTPHFTLLGDDGNQWTADGERATLGPDANTFELAGNAVLRQPADGWQLETDVLHYDLPSKHAWSDSDAVFTQNEQRTRGDRFNGWVDEDRMTLEGNVQGFHPPIRQ